MEAKGYLTSEKIKQRFVSQFDLVNYAIKLAANMIMTGRDGRVKIDSQNRAMQVLSEILHDRDYFDDIVEDQPETHEESEELVAPAKTAKRSKDKS